MSRRTVEPLSSFEASSSPTRRLLQTQSPPSEFQRVKWTQRLFCAGMKHQSVLYRFPVLRGNVPLLRLSTPDLSSSLISTGRLQSVRWVAASVMRKAGRRCAQAERPAAPPLLQLEQALTSTEVTAGILQYKSNRLQVTQRACRRSVNQCADK